MQHVDGVLELGNIEGAIFTIRMHSNFNDSSADECNRPPVAGGTPCLNQTQLCGFRNASFAVEARRKGLRPEAPEPNLSGRIGEKVVRQLTQPLGAQLR